MTGNYILDTHTYCQGARLLYVSAKADNAVGFLQHVYIHIDNDVFVQMMIVRIFNVWIRSAGAMISTNYAASSSIRRGTQEQIE
jgi:hypothetical protein